LEKIGIDVLVVTSDKRETKPIQAACLAPASVGGSLLDEYRLRRRAGSYHWSPMGSSKEPVQWNAWAAFTERLKLQECSEGQG